MALRIFSLFLLLMCAPLWAQDAAPDFDELWRVGCLWEVGDNREKVTAARKAIIDAGEPGLHYAISRLAATDTLVTRCLETVILGFGEAAVKPLIAQVAHAEPSARRNVAELLAKLDARTSADALLAQAQVETNDGARLSQLAALAKWQTAQAVPLLVTLSRGDNQRIRQRAPSLLVFFESTEAAARLVEMLEDPVFHVRDAAVEALKIAAPSVKERCIKQLQTLLQGPSTGSSIGLTSRLVTVAAHCGSDGTSAALQRALTHTDAGVRADAAQALAAWKRAAGLLDTIDVKALLQAAAKAEADPFARAEMLAAIEKLNEK